MEILPCCILEKLGVHLVFLSWSKGCCGYEKMARPWLSHVHIIHLCHPEFLSSCRRGSFVWKFCFLLSHCISELLIGADFRLNATVVPKSGVQCSCGSLSFRILWSPSGFYTTAKVDYLFQGRNYGKCICLIVYIKKYFSCLGFVVCVLQQEGFPSMSCAGGLMSLQCDMVEHWPIWLLYWWAQWSPVTV